MGIPRGFALSRKDGESLKPPVKRGQSGLNLDGFRIPEWPWEGPRSTFSVRAAETGKTAARFLPRSPGRSPEIVLAPGDTARLSTLGGGLRAPGPQRVPPPAGTGPRPATLTPRADPCSLYLPRPCRKSQPTANSLPPEGRCSDLRRKRSCGGSDSQRPRFFKETLCPCARAHSPVPVPGRASTTPGPPCGRKLRGLLTAVPSHPGSQETSPCSTAH